MKAIILAAGHGNRMRPFTNLTHKTLLSVGNKTILNRIIDGLHENSVKDIIIVTGFRADDIRNYLSDIYPGASFTYVHNERYRETNNIFSLAMAFDSIEITSDIIIIESDLIYNPSVVRQLLESCYDDVALVDRFRSGMDGTVVTVDENDVITSVIPPHLQDENFDFSNKFKTLNIYKFSKQFCLTSFKKLLSYYANVIDDNCYYELILGILIYMQKEVVHAEKVGSKAWAEVDDPNDLTVAEFVFNKDRSNILDDSMGGFWNYDILDFCFIRNMHFPDSSIISEVKNNLSNLMHNYGSKQLILNLKMSWFLLCNEERVIALNGASQIYPILQQYYDGRKILIPNPTFGEYGRIFANAKLYSDEVGIASGEIYEKLECCDVVVLVNPNNPTGSAIPTDWIYDTAAKFPNKTFIVDESFIEFSGNESLLRFLEEKPLDNVVVIKSLSKSLGIPGVRLGYVYSCNVGFRRYAHDRIPIWNMNSLAEFMLELLLKHRNTLQQSIERTISDREKFISDLTVLKMVEKVYPSGGNYVLVRMKDVVDSKYAVKWMLREHSIYVKDVSRKFSSKGQFLRLAVRLQHENNILIAALGQLGSLFGENRGGELVDVSGVG